MNNIQNIIISIGILIGIILFKWTKPIFLKVIFIGLVLTFLLHFLSSSFLVINVTVISIGILSLIYSIYCGLHKKWANLIIGIFAFATILWTFLSWPYYGELQMSMIIPFCVYIFTLIKWKKNIQHLSILSILGMYDFSLFLELINKWIF